MDRKGVRMTKNGQKSSLDTECSARPRYKPLNDTYVLNTIVKIPV